METKDAGIGAAVAVLLAILGLIVLIGVILLMMWKQPGIESSPSQSRLHLPVAASELSAEPPMRCCGEQFLQSRGIFRGEA